MPLLFIIGIVGNSISFVIYSREFFAKSSTSFYLRLLSIVESLAVLMTLGIFVENGLDLKFKSLTDATCKLASFYTYIFCALSAHIRSYVSFERMLCILFPNKFTFLASSRTKIFITILVVSFNFAIYSPILFLFQTFKVDQVISLYNESSSSSSINSTNLTTTSTQICLSHSDSYNFTLVVYDLLNSTLIPFALMLVFTTLTIKSLNKSRNNALRSSSTTATPDSNDALRKREQKDLQFALTSILICFAFFIFNIGIIFFKFLLIYDEIKPIYFNLLWTIFRILFYADYSSKIFIYMIASKRFRLEMTQMFFV